ncbi:MAG: DUF4262 domain-containing protein [Phenylobacterium sp.]|uniref:DUF4262 domain-containing protein n=1 Tax=Phenylobacterium sp. TaxID=1871053 RepID=UPI003BB4E0A9
MWDEIYLAWAKWGFLRRVHKYGWTGNYIPGTDSETSFAYSIGLWERLDAPELIVFGADAEVSKDLITQAHAQLRTGQLKLADKAVWRPDGKGGPRLVWRAVHPSQIRAKYFSLAIWYRQHRKMGREGFRAFQLVMSDEHGVMPWEEGFSADSQPQPELYLPYFGKPEGAERGGRKPPRRCH